MSPVFQWNFSTNISVLFSKNPSLFSAPLFNADNNRWQNQGQISSAL
jgi:hypothetical protein